MSYFVPYIDDTGLHMPTYEDRLADLVSAYRSIFGPEAELSESVPDYQLLSVLAKALDDASALVLQAYNSRNPLYASGQALDLLLPLYGLRREAGEDDASARARISTALASGGAGSLDAVLAAVKAAQWVRSAKVYVNDTDTADARGIPAHSLAAVIHAGDAAAVAKAIYDKKAPGIGTYGSESVTVTDGDGNDHVICFSRTSSAILSLRVTVRRLLGCEDETVKAALIAALRGYVNGLDIAETLIIPRLYAVAYNADPELSKTFAVADITAWISGMSEWTRDEIACAWNQKLSLANGAVTVTFTG